MKNPRHVMLIRHAEKPLDGHAGVARDGAADPDELSVRGWQRAGALARFFAPSPRRLALGGVVRPKLLFAVRPTLERPSRRTGSTLEPLARLLGCAVCCEFTLGDELALAHHVRTLAEDALIAWEHKELPTIAVALAPVVPLPGVWPDDRYDLVWTFTWQDGQPDFRQVPQLLLADDLDHPIA